MKYTFLQETSSKMLFRHIKEVENCARFIIGNYFKTVKNMPIIILSLQLDTILSTEDTFSFSVHTFSEKYPNDMFWHVSIPTKTFDTCDEEWTENIEDVLHEVKTTYSSKFK